MRPRVRAVLAAAALCAVTAPALGATLKVGKGKTYGTIGDAVAAAQQDDKILVFRGVYTENVLLMGGIDGLQFVGKKGAVWDGGPRDGVACLDMEGDGIVVQGFVFRNGRDHVRLRGNKVSIKKCTFRGNGGDSVHIDGDDARVEKCKFRGTVGNSIEIEGDRAVVMKNDFRNAQGGSDDGEREGVVFVMGLGTLVQKNSFKTIYRDAIFLRSGVRVMKAGDGAQVIKNQILNCTDEGIRTGLDDEERFDEVLISKNKVMHGDDDGIEAHGNGVLIERNTIRMVNNEGIEAHGNDVVITRNTVSDCLDEEGIDAHGDRIEVSDNKVASTDEEGILVNGDDCRVLRNLVRDVFDDDSIKVRNENNMDELAEGGLIEGNLILDGVDDGMEVDMNDGTIRGNTIRGCGTDCFAEGIDFHGDDTTIELNLIDDQTGAGIKVDGDRNVLSRNTVKNGHQDGIRIQDAFDTRLTDCTVLACDGEGFDNNGQDTTATGCTFLRNHRDIANSGTVTNSGTFATDNKFVTGDLMTGGVIGCPD